MVEKDSRWYDKKDPSARSWVGKLIYNFAIGPIIRRKFRKLSGQIKITGEYYLTFIADEVTKSGKAILVVANHVSDEDTTLIPFILDKHWNAFSYKIGKLELFRNPVMRLILYSAGVRPIDRNAGTRDLKIIQKLIDDKKIIVCFPTGHRDPENKTPIEIGMPLIIEKNKEKVLVLPIELINTNFIKDGKTVYVKIKRPIVVEELPISPGRRGALELMNIIAEKINVPGKLVKKKRDDKEKVVLYDE